MKHTVRAALRDDDWDFAAESLAALNEQWRQVQKQIDLLIGQLEELEPQAEQLSGEADIIYEGARLSDEEISALEDAGLAPDEWDVDRAPRTPSRPESDY